jgi:ubiquinone/menaquinone biosynthesis C-methylase UbiE
MTRSKDNFWEFENRAIMFSHLIGNSYGDNPEACVDQIRAEKAQMGAIIATQLRLNGRQAVLEIGSGTGYVAQAVAPLARSLKCCDISESFLKIAAQECCEHSNISFQHIQSAQFPFAENSSFDAAYALNVFIHMNLYEMHCYFEELSRVLKPQGRLWIDVMNANSLEKEISPQFLEMAALYRESPSALPLLLSYVSREAVCRISEHFGFRELSNANDHPHWMLFEKMPI